MENIHVGATSFDNYTDLAQNIINRVRKINIRDECCDYENQILDKFCAREVRKLEDVRRMHSCT